MDKKHIIEVCKLGKGEECCAYFVMGPQGAECAKGTPIAYQIELRLAEGSMNAKGDNCAGWKEIEDANPPSR